MDFLINAFNLILYQPLFNVLILIYQYLPGQDLGMAVIVLTVLIRLILSPLMAQSIRSQKALSTLQPKIQELQEKFKNDKEKQAREVMELYRREKINPLGGCLPLLLQMPILIALFRVFLTFRDGIGAAQSEVLYSFVSLSNLPAEPMFLGLVNLAQPSWVLAILAGVCQFFQTKMLSPKTGKVKSSDQMAKLPGMMQKQMLYFFPFFIFFILLRLPAAIGLYWIVTALFSIAQQYLVFAKKPAADSG
jgi:YidC/Oxa1 family membrane protein insertase